MGGRPVIIILTVLTSRILEGKMDYLSSEARRRKNEVLRSKKRPPWKQKRGPSNRNQKERDLYIWELSPMEGFRCDLKKKPSLD